LKYRQSLYTEGAVLEYKKDHVKKANAFSFSVRIDDFGKGS
jgi:hypothetical protein